MPQGWIKLDRKLLEHWLWGKQPFSDGQAWIDLLLLANHKDEKLRFDGKIHTITKGSRITSIRKLSDRWGWSKDKTVRFLNILEEDQMIKRKSDTKRTVITITNYGFFQSPADNGETPDTNRTPTGHQRDTGETPTGTNKNDKNEKNENKRKKGGAAACPLPGAMTEKERKALAAELRK